MQYSTVFLALFAATGAMAAPKNWNHKPYDPPSDKAVTVVLRDSAESAVTFPREPSNKALASRTDRRGPFQEVELVLGEAVSNKDLRCQILGEDGAPIVVLRGDNTDITFSDADKGPWKLRAATKVQKVVCDPEFKKIEPEDERLQVSVLLQSDTTGRSFNLGGTLENSIEVADNENFDKVTLTVSGEFVDPALRCQIHDENDAPIVILRGNNTDITFSDADKGPWQLRTPTKVRKIVCDPNFQQIDPADKRLQVSVLLQSDTTGRSFSLSGVRENSLEIADGESFDKVTLSVTGELVDPALRCQILSVVLSIPEIQRPEGEPIQVTRKDSVELTFADGGKGAWDFEAQPVSKIVCSPAFKKGGA